MLMAKDGVLDLAVVAVGKLSTGNDAARRVVPYHITRRGSTVPVCSISSLGT